MNTYLDGRRQAGTPAAQLKCPYEGLKKLAWWRGRREAQKTRAALGRSVGSIRQRVNP